MRIPKIDSRNLNNVEKERIVNINYYTDPNMYVPDWKNDEKTRNKFIKKIESIVRKSLEYKSYIKFLKDEVNMNNCAFFKNLDRTKLYNIGIEIHHTPLTLYDITSIVLNYMDINDIYINERSVAEEVLKCHYRGIVGLIPLSLTAHELVHSGDIFIPVDKVYGDVQSFVMKYYDGMTQEQIEMLEKHIEETNKINKYSPSVLEKKITYLNIDGMDLPKYLKEDAEKVI